MEVRVLHIISKDIACQRLPGVQFLGGDESGAAVFIVCSNSIVKVGNVLQLKSVKFVNLNKEKHVKMNKKTNSFIIISEK
jgi:hypothetical protein